MSVFLSFVCLLCSIDLCIFNPKNLCVLCGRGNSVVKASRSYCNTNIEYLPTDLQRSIEVLLE